MEEPVLRFELMAVFSTWILFYFTWDISKIKSYWEGKDG